MKKIVLLIICVSFFFGGCIVQREIYRDGSSMTYYRPYAGWIYVDAWPTYYVGTRIWWGSHPYVWRGGRYGKYVRYDVPWTHRSYYKSYYPRKTYYKKSYYKKPRKTYHKKSYSKKPRKTYYKKSYYKKPRKSKKSFYKNFRFKNSSGRSTFEKKYNR